MPSLPLLRSSPSQKLFKKMEKETKRKKMRIFIFKCGRERERAHSAMPNDKMPAQLFLNINLPIKLAKS